MCPHCKGITISKSLFRSFYEYCENCDGSNNKVSDVGIVPPIMSNREPKWRIGDVIGMLGDSRRWIINNVRTRDSADGAQYLLQEWVPSTPNLSSWSEKYMIEMGMKKI
jgi:hypothetical protein